MTTKFIERLASDGYVYAIGYLAGRSGIASTTSDFETADGFAEAIRTQRTHSAKSLHFQFITYLQETNRI